jgi:hypothetical protein
VRAGELSLCAGRICLVSAGGAYALALLAIDALGESVSLSEKTQTREVMPQQRQANNPRPLTQPGKPRAQVTWREHLCPFPENEIHSAEADPWLPTRPASAPSTQSGVNTREDTHNDQGGGKPPPDLQDNPHPEQRRIWPPMGTLARSPGLRRPHSRPW